MTEAFETIDTHTLLTMARAFKSVDTPPAIEHRINFQSCLEEVCKTRDAVMAAVCSFGFDKTEQFAIKLSLEEALANAIWHGNAGDSDKYVFVHYVVNAEQVSVTISDEGLGFDPAQTPDPTVLANLQKPGGRGVLLINTYMDEVIYNTRGNRLTMIKHRGRRA